ncbi:MAG: arsenate reductase family protein [Eubacteriales bacterium]|nr:arsenate reductase family protein [Eubacteriales bacterium]
MRFLYYPKCTTCRRAKACLDAQKVKYEAQDLVSNPPTAAELKTWHQASGLPLTRFFNTSGRKYRALGLAEQRKTMTEDEQYDLLASDGMLIKRPILISDSGQVILGFQEAEYHALLKKLASR